MPFSIQFALLGETANETKSTIQSFRLGVVPPNVAKEYAKMEWLRLEIFTPQPQSVLSFRVGQAAQVSLLEPKNSSDGVPIQRTRPGAHLRTIGSSEGSSWKV